MMAIIEFISMLCDAPYTDFNPLQEKTVEYISRYIDICYVLFKNLFTDLIIHPVNQKFCDTFSNNDKLKNKL